jgi:putative transposase
VHPERWSGDTRNWDPVSIVYLNPDQASSNAAEVDENELLRRVA